MHGLLPERDHRTISTPDVASISGHSCHRFTFWGSEWQKGHANHGHGVPIVGGLYAQCSTLQAPSAVLRSGRPSTTFLKCMARIFSAASTAGSLMQMRIKTGRRHQIRLHCAHVGHVVVTDSKYAAVELYRIDTSWCPRNFLHRFSLTFHHNGNQVVALEGLPQDLRRVIASAKVFTDLQLDHLKAWDEWSEENVPRRSHVGSGAAVFFMWVKYMAFDLPMC